jgi:transformation/transcription domain-associated protein
MRKTIAARAAAQASVESVRRSNSDQPMRDANESAPLESTPSATPSASASDSHPPGATSLALPSNGVADSTPYPRHAWEHVDEILQTLKTTFPLLILSLETMVDQIQHKFKPSPEEEVYRTICMLISDAIQV